MRSAETGGASRMWFWTAAALSLAALAAQTGAQTSSARSVQESFVGLYTLAEYAGHGERPTGRISYDGAGRMWAMLLPPGREPVSDTSTPEEYRAAMTGLVAYYGTYEIDEGGGRVIHHVEAASNPAWIGAEFVRWYRLDDRDLTLSLNAEFSNTLLWQRLPD